MFIFSFYPMNDISMQQVLREVQKPNILSRHSCINYARTHTHGLIKSIQIRAYSSKYLYIPIKTLLNQYTFTNWILMNIHPSSPKHRFACGGLIGAYLSATTHMQNQHKITAYLLPYSLDALFLFKKYTKCVSKKGNKKMNLSAICALKY